MTDRSVTLCQEPESVTSPTPNREARAQAILAAAARVFARRGLESCTMEEIAREAGVAKGTLYLYFPSKQELFLAVFDAFGRQLIAEGAALMATEEFADAPFAMRLPGLLHNLFDWDEAFLELIPLWMEFWAAAGSGELRERLASEFRELYVEVRALLADMIRDGQATGELRADLDVPAHAAMIAGALDGVMLQAIFDDAFDPVAALHGFLPSLIRGMSVKQTEETDHAH